MRFSSRPLWTSPNLTLHKLGRYTSIIVSILVGSVGLALCFFLLLEPSLTQADSPPETATMDSFVTNQPLLSLTSPQDMGKNASSSVSGEGILGAERDLEIRLTGRMEGTRLKAGVNGGAFFMDSGPAAEGIVQFVWDGADGDPLVLDHLGLGQVDLTDDGQQNAFLIEIGFNDSPANLILEVFSDEKNSSLFTANLPDNISKANQMEIVIPFSDFRSNLGEGVDFSSVGAVTLSITAADAPDLIMNSIRLVSLLSTSKSDALLIDQNEDGQANPGDSLQYTVNIFNPADFSGSAVSRVVFTDTLDVNTTLITGSVKTTQGTVTSGNGESDTDIVVEIDSIADGDSVTIVFEGLINNPLPDEVSDLANQGFVSSQFLNGLPTDDPETDSPGDATLTPVFPATPAPAKPVVSATKVDLLPDGGSEGEVSPGDVLTYTVVISSSEAEATEVVFSDTLDVNTALVTGSVTTTQGTVTSGNGERDTEVVVEIGSIANGDSVTILFGAVVNDPLPEGGTQLTNQGSVGGSNFAAVMTDDPDTEPDGDSTVTPIATP